MHRLAPEFQLLQKERPVHRSREVRELRAENGRRRIEQLGGRGCQSQRDRCVRVIERMAAPYCEMATGETALGAMLASLDVEQREGRYAFISAADELPSSINEVDALIRESEGWTVVAPVSIARENGWDFDFEAAWLTLRVHSALEAVGLTAAVSTALADAGIACNMIAGFYHDHLLVPYESAEAAIACLAAVREAS